MGKEAKPLSADIIKDGINSVGGRNVTRVNPFGEGEVAGSGKKVERAVEGVMEAAVEKTLVDGVDKKPAKRYPFIVPC